MIHKNENDKIRYDRNSDRYSVSDLNKNLAHSFFLSEKNRARMLIIYVRKGWT